MSSLVRGARRGAPLVLLGAVVTAAFACARQGYPPGGPEDRLPPAVVATEPEPFAVVEPGLRTFHVRFDGRISERIPSGRLEDAVQVSPRTGAVRVEHHRDGLEITLLGGARPGTVYRVTVLPVIQDLFGNRMTDAFEFFFSTGPAFTGTVVAGMVWDRVTGRAVPGAAVLATPIPEEEIAGPHSAVADTSGVFALRHLPPGRYQLTAFADPNRNARPDRFEARGDDTVAVAEADTVILSLSVLEPDSTAAVLTGAEIADSVTVRLTFDDPLAADQDLRTVEVGLGREEGAAPGIVSLLTEAEWAERQPDTARVGPRAARPGAGRGPSAGPGGEPLPPRTLLAVATGPLERGVLYEVRVSGVRNVNGVPGGGGRAEVRRPLEPAPDTAAAGAPPSPPDTAAAAGPPPPDTTAAGIGPSPPDDSRRPR